MSSRQEWAEKEIEMACKKENPEWDGKSFDYGCSCYQSALKAYKSLEKDEHSGCSWNITKNILIRLMNGLPLYPITDNDFDKCDNLTIIDSTHNSEKQCPRMSSLFRKENNKKEIFYSDIDRVFCVDIHNPKNTFTSNRALHIVDDMFPIRMPYYPNNGKYIVYTESFLTNEDNGDYDTQEFIYLITPEKEKIELNIFEGEVDGKFTTITKEEYEERKKKAIHF